MRGRQWDEAELDAFITHDATRQTKAPATLGHQPVFEHWCYDCQRVTSVQTRYEHKALLLCDSCASKRGIRHVAA